MKSFLIALVVLFSGFQAQAWWLVQPYYQIQPQVVHATVHNPYYRPLYCQGQVWGITQTGQWVSTWMNTWVPPFQSRYVYAYTYYPYYFVGANSSIYCQ